MKFVFREIRPKRAKFIDPDFFKKEIFSELKGPVKTDVIGEFKKTVQGWKSPPEFGHRFRVTLDSVSVEIFPMGSNAKKYLYVALGTKPRIIRPNRAKALSFKTGYKAGTTPGRIMSRGYTRSGKRIARGLVHHPGIEPRLFHKTIAKEYKDDFKRRIENAVRRAVRHGK